MSSSGDKPELQPESMEARVIQLWKPGHSARHCQHKGLWLLACPRKVAMPLSADMPAPVKMTMRRAWRKALAMACAVLVCMVLSCPWVIKSPV